MNECEKTYVHLEQETKQFLQMEDIRHLADRRQGVQSLLQLDQRSHEMHVDRNKRQADFRLDTAQDM